ncbi:MAG: hypothetical protein AAGD25_22395 [Cyanobacteria bacterium P01_F01_bin.150]
MPNFLNQNLHQMLWNPLKIWLGEHPLVYWFLSHPLILLGLSLLILLLLAGLVSAIAQLTQNLWLRLLQLPVQLVRALGQAIAIGFQRLLQYFFKGLTADESDEPVPTTESSVLLLSRNDSFSSYTNLQALLNRLERVRQEEAELIEQIKLLADEQLPK